MDQPHPCMNYAYMVKISFCIIVWYSNCEEQSTLYESNANCIQCMHCTQIYKNVFHLNGLIIIMPRHYYYFCMQIIEMWIYHNVKMDKYKRKIWESMVFSSGVDRGWPGMAEAGRDWPVLYVPGQNRPLHNCNTTNTDQRCQICLRDLWTIERAPGRHIPPGRFRFPWYRTLLMNYGLPGIPCAEWNFRNGVQSCWTAAPLLSFAHHQYAWWCPPLRLCNWLSIVHIIFKKVISIQHFNSNWLASFIWKKNVRINATFISFKALEIG